MNQQEEKQVPKQETGAQSNTEANQHFGSKEEAADFYNRVKTKLKDVNSWHKYAGALTADFKLCDAAGNEVQRPVQKGDYFKIDIPGPGSATGDGYDWVQVEKLEEVEEADQQSMSILVRPAPNPTNANPDVAHFFSDEATSCFMVSRQGTAVKAAVYGRNEKPNTDTEKTLDTIRNAAVAGGAVNGFSKLQWKSLVTGLLQN